MKRILSAALVALLIASPAFAITAGDVLDRMTEKERGGYLSGAIEMAMVAKPEKSECILNWFYGSGAPGPKTVIATLERYRDKPAAAVINALINKNCPN